jgi:cytoskeletal protein CcmA (bactofilin family)
MSQLGRIGGQVLTDNLLRAGVDLAFETDLLYLDVTNNRIGVRNGTLSYDLDVDGNIKTTNLTVDTQASIGNIRINNSSTFTTSVGGIDVYINGGGEIWHDRLITDNLVIDGNLISSVSNSNIVLDPNGSGSVELLTDTNITGDLVVTGNITMSGNLTGLGTLTFGDQTIDTVTVNTDFTQSVLPGDDITYDLGADAGDSSPRRWAELHSPEWRYISTGAWNGSGIQPQNVTVSGQMTLDGVLNKISAIQSNDDIFLSPNTGITYIERTKWEGNDLTNLNNTPLTISSTGIGYYVFANNNAFVVPAGADSGRRASPEVGETRWNTDQQYLECFDGAVWAVSIGGGGSTITPTDMEDLSTLYTIVFG